MGDPVSPFSSKPRTSRSRWRHSPAQAGVRGAEGPHRSKACGQRDDGNGQGAVGGAPCPQFRSWEAGTDFGSLLGPSTPSPVGVPFF